MWHEARKQERKIRGMLVDYRKRAERRQDFYEKIKGDPTQFMQIHGRRCKIHLDPAIAAAGESPAIMMPWQGQSDNLIDRFDVRAHLDFIPPVPKIQQCEESELTSEERQCNYERYRILAQNDFLVIPEEKFLNQLYLEEQFGVQAQIELEKANKKPKPNTGAAIGYTYEDDNDQISYPPVPSVPLNVTEEQEDDDSDSDLDVDVAIDISKLDTTQAHELNGCGRNFGMKSNDFYSFLTKDADEAESLRMAKEEEAEKILLSGRKSRRERRLQREKKLPGRTLSPPSYAAKEEPDPRLEDKNESGDSRSPSPDNSGKVVYITSFGGEDELQPHSKISINLNTKSNLKTADSSVAAGFSYADKVKQNLDKFKKLNNFNDPRKRRSPTYSRSRSRSHSRSRYRRSRSTHRRSRSPYRRDRHYDRRASRRRRRYSRSRSRSRRRDTRSRSRSRRRRSSSKSPTKSPKILQKSKSPIKKEIKPEILVPLPPVQQVPLFPQIPEIIQPKEEPPPLKRYYGRRKEDHTSSDESDSNDSDNKDKDDISDVHVASPNSEKPSILTLHTQQNSNSSSSGSAFGKTTLITDSKNLIGLSSSSLNDQSAPNSSSSTSTKLNPRDRLKKKMQILLNKQFVADKKAEIERTERQIQQQQEREQEMRELALKLRRRQRELRHKYGTPTTSQSGSRSNSKSKSKSKSPTIPALMSIQTNPNLSPEGHRTRRSKSRSRSPQRADSRNRRNYRSKSRSREHRKVRERSSDRYHGEKRNRSGDRNQDRDYDRKYSTQSKNREREHNRNREDRERERNRDREREKDRDRNRERERDNYRGRDQDFSVRDRPRNERDRYDRGRDRSNYIRENERDYNQDRKTSSYRAR